MSKPVLRDSEELKQFLGVAGGEHVSFVKPSVVHVPRVDKVWHSHKYHLNKRVEREKRGKETLEKREKIERKREEKRKERERKRKGQEKEGTGRGIREERRRSRKKREEKQEYIKDIL